MSKFIQAIIFMVTIIPIQTIDINVCYGWAPDCCEPTTDAECAPIAACVIGIASVPFRITFSDYLCHPCPNRTSDWEWCRYPCTGSILELGILGPVSRNVYFGATFIEEVIRRENS